MSDSDKTRQKLLDSIRKTKAGTPDEAASPPSEAKDAPKSRAPAASAAGGRRAKPRAKPKAATPKATTAGAEARTTANKPSADGAGDPYRSARRVWPD